MHPYVALRYCSQSRPLLLLLSREQAAELAVVPAAALQVVVLYASLYTCDPGDIEDAITALAQHKVRCSVVGLGAELHVAKRISDSTSGDFVVALNEQHYRWVCFHSFCIKATFSLILSTSGASGAKSHAP